MNFMNSPIQEVEFSTSYPNRDNKGFTYIAIVRLQNNHHYMVWSPYIEKLDFSIGCEDSYIDYRDRNNHLLEQVLSSRYVEISGGIYASHFVEGGFYFKIFDLEDYKMKPKISKKRVEELFNCQVVD